MKILLDTHAFLWWISDDPRLGKAARERIADHRNEVFLSVASTWELAIKVNLGRLAVSGNFETWLLSQLAGNRFEVLPILLPHVLALTRLPPHHKDPFDRILIAQAIGETMTFLTADAHIAQYPVEVVW